MVRKRQEKLRKMTKFRKCQLKMGIFEKSQGKFFKTYQILSIQLHSLYFKAFNW